MVTIAKGYLGIDNGTHGLSVIFTDEDLNVLATGEGSYGFVDDLESGNNDAKTGTMLFLRRWNRFTSKWLLLRSKLLRLEYPVKCTVQSAATNPASQPSKSVRLWCDARNEEEGNELKELLQTKVPKRATAARFLWTCRNQPDAATATATAHITTPAGWLAFRLTGEFNLGIGDAAGMFPINQSTKDYDKEKLAKYDELVNNASVPSLGSILPNVRKAGENAGSLTESAATQLGLSGCAGIQVAAAKGDQVAALAGSLIGQAGMVSCSFGTSVCANAVGDRAFHGVSRAVDQFCAADGKPINMVWLRNGTIESSFT